MSADNYDDLNEFNKEAKPERAFPLDLDGLPNGTYEFVVEKAELTHAGNGSRVCELRLRPDGGAVVRQTHWINDQRGMNKFLADLLALGFPANNWGRGGQPLGTALPAAVAKLPGRRFKGVKTSNKAKDGTEKVFHDLHIGSVVNGAPMPQAPAAPSPQPVAAGVGAPDDDAPF